ncbi:MAG: biopolymer transporter ExbD [Verrucomicrobia bacterium]|nr:biopolymer transporter ExbD [Verrucomicrobiota bacterium]
MRRRFATRQGEFEEATINLTPLIDVVFVVLIIFIIIAPMLELDRVELANAAPSDQRQVAATPENAGITIHVHQDNTIWLKGRQVTIEELTAGLKNLKRTSGSQIPQLFHDKRAYFGTYQSVKNAVESAGFDELDIILKPG